LSAEGKQTHPDFFIFQAHTGGYLCSPAFNRSLLMKSVALLNTHHPWRNGLIATTGLSLFTVLTTLLWSAGHAEWAFVLAFMTVWLLISLFWSNDEFNEESGSILARIVDHNFDQMHERLEQLEQELDQIRSKRMERGRQAA
jgi:hypothetical protein